MKHLEAANSSFVFETVTNEKIEKLVTNLNIRKAAQSNDIPTKLVKEFGYLFSKYIATSINRCIAEGTFVNVFKGAMKLYLTYCYCAIIILFKQVYTSLYFLPIPLKNEIFSFCDFGVFVCSEFDVIFISFYNICLIIIDMVSVRYSAFCSCLSFLT